jgi:ribosome biogenesis protein SSF1/2
VLLVHRDKASGALEFRHFAIRAVPVGLSRGVKKIAVRAAGRLPDLGRLDDVAQFVLNGGRAGGGGATSESEAEDEAAHVTLPQS